MHCILETWQPLCATLTALLHCRSRNCIIQISKHWLLQHSIYSVADVQVLGKLVITLLSLCRVTCDIDDTSELLYWIHKVCSVANTGWMWGRTALKIGKRSKRFQHFERQVLAFILWSAIPTDLTLLFQKSTLVDR
jgi:hypothetical protein